MANTTHATVEKGSKQREETKPLEKNFALVKSPL